MSRTLTLRNRQRIQPVDLRLLRGVVRALLQDLLHLETFELSIHVVGAPEMTHLNETFLRHEGSTDVITFDYSDPALPSFLGGDIFVCMDEAVRQAKRFRVTWQNELVRYIVHGVLHLQGYDDHRKADRRKMKAAETRLLQKLAAQFPLPKLGKRRKAVRKTSPKARN
ncbi:MAG TPA: rRNA maturation RNase YbeY [Clostridia bacterium]|nr:rRNA maturation RNase YbeY [Clostridia bacterium]